MSAERGADEIDRSPSERVDACVIGSGPGGSLVADALAERGHDVVVLEAGPRFDPEDRYERMRRHLRPEYDAFDVWEMGGERDAYTSSGRLEYSLNHGRVKGVGGTSLHWGAIVPRYHEKDFEMETRYGLAEDWPIDYDELRPYYAAAERELGVAGEPYPFEPPREEPFPMEAFPPSYSDELIGEACEALGLEGHSLPNARNLEPYDDRPACEGYGICSPVCPIGASYSADVHVRKAEANGARVLDRAPVTRLEHDASGERIEAAVYATPDGERRRQEARRFVLACGAIETPRLLLLSRSEHHPDGLANSSGAVGRYLMDHPLVSVGGRLRRPTRQGHVNFTSSGSHSLYDHEDPSPGSIQLQFFNGVAPSFTDLALESHRWGDDLLVDLQSAYGREIGTMALTEQLPRAENRVTLDSTATDDRGDPAPEIVWDVGAREVETVREALRTQRAILTELGAVITWDGDPEHPGDAAHPMGTTRMGENPETSVVDPRMRTHDVENLYVSSSSVFVTGGAANPTLTIAALALKVADHVDEDL